MVIIDGVERIKLIGIIRFIPEAIPLHTSMAKPQEPYYQRGYYFGL